VSHYAFNWFALPPFVTALCSLLTGVMLYRREWSSRAGQVLMAVMATLGFWFATAGMLYLSADASTALLWARICYVAIPLLPSALYLYSSVGLRFYDRQKILVWLSFLAGIVFIVLAYNTDLLLEGVRKYWWGYYPVYGVAGSVFLGYYGLVIIVGQVQFRAVLHATARGTLYHGRALMSAIALGVMSTAAVDFPAKYGVALYPFGYVSALAFIALVVMMERRYRIVYMTPAFASGQILETMQGAVLVADVDGSLEVGNKAAGELLGYTEAELLELSFGDVFASQSGWRTVLDKLTAGEPVRTHETVWRLKSGQTVDVSLSASLIREGKNPSPLGIVMAALDITDRKRAEAALKKSEEQLRQSQKMEAIGQLAGGIAHDFNNMLTAIIGNSALALATMPETDTNRGLIVDIHEVGERAAVLTKQILAFSRRQVLKPEVLSLNQVVADLEPLLRRSIGEDVALRLNLAPDLRPSEVDRNQIGQVVLNLAVNARDAMPSGGHLVVETANADFGEPLNRRHPEIDPGEYVALIVTDNGCGMDATVRAKLFEPFFTTKPKGKGTGLGLSTVFGIVKQSGGAVYVYSEPGLGSTFKVYMPVAKQATRPGTGTQVPSERGRVTQVAGRAGGRIMVVEDEPQVRNLIVRVLSAAGYEVKAAGSAERVEALLGTAGYEPDMLVTDVVLPGGIDGRQVADRLSSRFPGLPVLFMSGYTKDAVVHDGRLDEGIEFLEKPFTPDALLQRVRDVLERKGCPAR
jgi:two-component system, cell cycle sensor histidine kinase and response regulator CckA